MRATPAAPGPAPDADEAARRLIARWEQLPHRAAIFDFNGTLSNDEPILLQLYTELFRERLGWTLTPEEYYVRLAGRSDREIIETALAEVGVGEQLLADQLLAERHTRYAELVALESPIPERVASTVTGLSAAGVPLGIVTGAQRGDVELVLARSALGGMFRAIVTEEDVRTGKPDPEGFRLAASALESDPATILVFEDSLPGVKAAKAAGMLCIGVEGTLPRDQLAREADATVSAITPTLFASLG